VGRPTPPCVRRLSARPLVDALHQVPLVGHPGSGSAVVDDDVQLLAAATDLPLTASTSLSRCDASPCRGFTSAAHPARDLVGVYSSFPSAFEAGIYPSLSPGVENQNTKVPGGVTNLAYRPRTQRRSKAIPGGPTGSFWANILVDGPSDGSSVSCGRTARRTVSLGLSTRRIEVLSTPSLTLWEPPFLKDQTQIITFLSRPSPRRRPSSTHIEFEAVRPSKTRHSECPLPAACVAGRCDVNHDLP